MTGAHSRALQLIPTGAAAALALVCVAPHSATASAKVRVKTTLAATSVDANARGQTGLALRGVDGKFEVKVSRLDHNSSYDVVVKGVKVGTLQTTTGGGGHLRFSSRPGPKDLVLGFDPRGTQLSVRGADGHDVLVGTMPADTVDPTAIACCLSDDDGESECEELTPDACTAAGGVASQAATCMSDPCATTPPAVTAVCCTNETGDDESESECEEGDSPADCAAVGGIVVQAASCEPNPCAPVSPPAGDEVACCVPDEDETECEVTTSEACSAAGGTATIANTCEPNPCATGDGDNGDEGGGDQSGNDGDGGTD